MSICESCIKADVCLTYFVEPEVTELPNFSCMNAVKEQPHGKWIYREYRYRCSCCGEMAIYHYLIRPLPHLTDFCPNCGADMRKEGD